MVEGAVRAVRVIVGRVRLVGGKMVELGKLKQLKKCVR